MQDKYWTSQRNGKRVWQLKIFTPMKPEETGKQVWFIMLRDSNTREARSVHLGEQQRVEAGLPAGAVFARPEVRSIQIRGRGCAVLRDGRQGVPPSRQASVRRAPALLVLSLPTFSHSASPKPPSSGHFHAAGSVRLCWLQMLEAVPRKTGGSMRWKKPYELVSLRK